MIKLLKKFVIIAIIVVIVISIVKSVDLTEIQNKLLVKIYPLYYIEHVEKYAYEYNVDKYLIFAIIKAESNYDENAVSNRGAKGLMQLMDATAEELAVKININLDENNIFTPDVNINLGTKYISILIEKYNNTNLALAAYNAGSGNVDKWIDDGTLKEDGTDIENVPFTETNNYVRKILRDYKIYEEVYG